jgi:hypothetical protein
VREDVEETDDVEEMDDMKGVDHLRVDTKYRGTLWNTCPYTGRS